MLLALSKFLPRAFHKKARRRSLNVNVEGQEPAGCDGRSGEEAPVSKPYTCRIILLDDTELTLNTKLSSKGSLLLKHVFDYLNLSEKQYFGLRYVDHNNQPHWLDTGRSISSQVQTAVPHTFYFGVKFYAADPCKLFDEITRYQFFLQIKRDIVQGRLPVNYDLAAELAAYAVQSELGDYDPRRHSPGYVSEFRFLPNQTEEFECRVASLHPGLKGQVPARAEYQYLDRVKWLDMYGVDLHPVQGLDGVDYFLGITPTGIIVYKNKKKIDNFFWPRLVKLSCKSKQFIVKIRDRNNDENTYTFECSSKLACKNLWKCCTEHHSFFRLTAASHSYQASNRVNSTESSNDASKPALIRKPSQRHQRRHSGSESCPEDFSVKPPRPLSAYILTQSVSSQRRDGYTSGPETYQRGQTAPWNGRHHRGLYSSGGSPISVRSELFPRRVCSGSESESTVYSQRYRVCHGVSDSDSRSNVTLRRQNRATADFTESESEAGNVSRRRRRRDRSTETLTYDESQWDYHSCAARESRITVGSSYSISSDCNSHRRHRSRSGNRRPPEELAQHFRYVDPAEVGITEDQLREIPYTHVETEGVMLRAKYSPRTRHRMRQRRQKSCGELSARPRSAWLPEGEAPPPYGDTGSSVFRHPSQPAVSEIHRARLSIPDFQACSRRELPVDFLKLPMTVQKTETQVAPIVKTKTAIIRTDYVPDREQNLNRSSQLYGNPAVTSSLTHQPTSCRPSAVSTFSTVANTPVKLEEITDHSVPHKTPCNSQTVQVKHIREDSGLEMDSPESLSHSSSTAGQQQATDELSLAATVGSFPYQTTFSLSSCTEQASYDMCTQKPFQPIMSAQFCPSSDHASPQRNMPSNCLPVRTSDKQQRHNGCLRSNSNAVPSRSWKTTEL